MPRILAMPGLLIVIFYLSGCGSPAFQTLFQEQEWSENYALANGVECTSPEMVDGELTTAGKTVFPEKAYGRTIYGAFPSAEAQITLPEKKSIHKIIIYSKNLVSFSVLASSGEKGDWKLIKKFDNNADEKIVIRTSVVTDKIKIRARPNSKFSGTEQGIAHGGIVTLRTAKVEEPEIEEIELYGFKTPAASRTKKSGKSNEEQAPLF